MQHSQSKLTINPRHKFRHFDIVYSYVDLSFFHILFYSSASICLVILRKKKNLRWITRKPVTGHGANVRFFIIKQLFFPTKKRNITKLKNLIILANQIKYPKYYMLNSLYPVGTVKYCRIAPDDTYHSRRWLLLVDDMSEPCTQLHNGVKKFWSSISLLK